MKYIEMEVIHPKLIEQCKLTYPISISIALSKNTKKIEEALGIKEEQRIKLLNQYAEHDEHGNPIVKEDRYVISDEKRNEFSEKYAELRMYDDLSIQFEKISIDEFKKCEESGRYYIPNAVDFNTLSFMIS